MFSAPATKDIPIGQYGIMKELKQRKGSGTFGDRKFSIIDESSGKVILESENYLKVLFKVRKDNLINVKIVEEFETTNNFDINGSNMKKISKKLNENRIIIVNKAGKTLIEQLICEADLFSVVYHALQDQVDGSEVVDAAETEIHPMNTIAAANTVPNANVIEIDDINDDSDFIGVFDAVEDIAKNATTLNKNDESEFMWQNGNNQEDPYANDGSEEELLVNSDDDFSQESEEDNQDNQSMEYSEENEEPMIPPANNDSTDVIESKRSSKKRK